MSFIEPIHRVAIDATKEQPDYYRKAKLREQITATAGDTESLLGTTTDCAHLVLVGLSELVAGLSTANSLAEIRQAATGLNELLSEFLQRVQGNQLKLPYIDKGFTTTLTDITHRAQAVSDVINGGK